MSSSVKFANVTVMTKSFDVLVIFITLGFIVHSELEHCANCSVEVGLTFSSVIVSIRWLLQVSFASLRCTSAMLKSTESPACEVNCSISEHPPWAVYSLPEHVWNLAGAAHANKRSTRDEEGGRKRESGRERVKGRRKEKGEGGRERRSEKEEKREGGGREGERERGREGEKGRQREWILIILLSL